MTEPTPMESVGAFWSDLGRVLDQARLATQAQEQLAQTRAELASIEVVLQDALDTNAVLDLRVAALQSTVAAQEAEIDRLRAELESSPVATFPGDPGPGKIIVGLHVTGQSETTLVARESAIGMKMAFRQFDNNGISDLAVPNGPVATRIKRDIAAGRMPVPSCRPGIENLAAHKFEAELVAFFKWYQEYLASVGKVGAFIAHHEPSNDWAADNNNLPAMAAHKADWAEAQRWLRACMNKAAGGRPKNIMFVGAFMTYEWSTQGVAQWGSADLLNPGLDPQFPTRHVFDMGCGDHYQPNLAGTTLEMPQLTAFLASMKKWGCPAGLTELGVKTSNPAQATVLKAFLAKAQTLGLRMVLYWDSQAGKGGQVSTDPTTWWELGPQALAAWTEFCKASGANPNAPAA